MRSAGRTRRQPAPRVVRRPGSCAPNRTRGIGGRGVGHAGALAHQLRERLLRRRNAAGSQLGEALVQQCLRPTFRRGARAQELLQIQRRGLEGAELIPGDTGPIGDFFEERSEPVAARDQCEGRKRLLEPAEVVQRDPPAEVGVGHRLRVRVPGEKGIVHLQGKLVVAIGDPPCGLAQELALVGPDRQRRGDGNCGHGKACAGTGAPRSGDARHPEQRTRTRGHVPLHPTY